MDTPTEKGHQTTYTVTIFVNVDRDGMVFGYRPDHQLATANDLTLTVNAISPEDAAEKAYHLGQKMGTDIQDHAWPLDVRSVSKGDLAKVVGTDGIHFFACASSGWEAIPEPPNPLVALAGTYATSRTTVCKECAYRMPEGETGDVCSECTAAIRREERRWAEQAMPEMQIWSWPKD